MSKTIPDFKTVAAYIQQMSSDEVEIIIEELFLQGVTLGAALKQEEITQECQKNP